MIFTKTFENFINAARQYCEFVETQVPESETAFLMQAEEHLQALYYFGKKLPVTENFADAEDKLTAAEMEKLLHFTAERLGDHRYYQVVFDPTEFKDDQVVAGDLLDDLGDIYKDLKNAILAFDPLTPDNFEHMQYEFTFLFEHHWGDHCADALYAIHYFKKKAN